MTEKINKRKKVKSRAASVRADEKYVHQYMIIAYVPRFLARMTSSSYHNSTSDTILRLTVAYG